MKLKDLRVKLELTQSEMGELLGISQQALYKIETGYQNRKETKIMERLLIALELIAERGLIDELKRKIGENK